jgi:hypothetical protein
MAAFKPVDGQWRDLVKAAHYSVRAYARLCGISARSLRRRFQREQGRQSLLAPFEGAPHLLGACSQGIGLAASALAWILPALRAGDSDVDPVGTTTYGYSTGGLLSTEDGPWASDTVTNG